MTRGRGETIEAEQLFSSRLIRRYADGALRSAEIESGYPYD